MEKGRLEAFTDGVIAVNISLMVLELKSPHEPSWAALIEHWPIFLSYVLSFVYVGIYWNNHHHLLHADEHVNGKVMWANLFFLFWLSLFPFATGWLNEARPLAASGADGVLRVRPVDGRRFLGAAEPRVDRLQRRRRGPARAGDPRRMGQLEGECLAFHLSRRYCAGVFVPIVSCGLYAVVAAIWFIPDKRIEEKVLEDKVSSP